MGGLRLRPPAAVNPVTNTIYVANQTSKSTMLLHLGTALLAKVKFSGHYCRFAYSALACFRMGMSESASFQRVRKSL